MSIYLLRKRVRECGLLLREVPGGGWCLVDVASGTVITGPLELENIEKVLETKNATQGATNTLGGEMEPAHTTTNSTLIVGDDKGDVKHELHYR